MTTVAQGVFVLHSLFCSRDSLVTANSVWLQAAPTGSGSMAREPLGELPAQQQQDPAQVTLWPAKPVSHLLLAYLLGLVKSALAYTCALHAL